MNVNTVRAVYQRLEHEGLIDSQQGSGTFVAPTLRTALGRAARSRPTRPARRRRPGSTRARSPPPCTLPPSLARPSTRPTERRRLLRTQIAGLERTLGELEAAHPGLLPAPSPRHRRCGPDAGAGVAELEQVRTELVRRLATVQAAIDGQAPGRRHRRHERTRGCA